MTHKIEINPITRIEGHAKVTLQVNDSGEVEDARLHITQLRGFEKFCEGRPFSEMPSLMARICGICPVSHLIASSKACDALLAVRIPAAAVQLRRILNLAQIIQSHALSFFHLSSPDLLLGMDADPARRHLWGVAQVAPQLARDGIRLRQMGQQIIEGLGGKRIHPAWVVPGGVSDPLKPEMRDRFLAILPEAFTLINRTLEWFKSVLPNFRDEIDALGNFPSLFLGLVTPAGGWEHYDGVIRVMEPSGRIIADQLDPTTFNDFIGEAEEPWSYLKFPYYKSLGYPQGIYRVGPLARLNLMTRCQTPRGEKAWKEFRSLQAGAVTSSFHQHYARLVEILIAFEQLEQLLSDPKILDTHVRATAGANALEGIGVSEAPRGILMHHYKINEHGLIAHANLIIATGHNNLAMNKAILQAARRFVRGKTPPESMLNRVEAAIRSYDPCLSCSTHALGQMPLHLEVVTSKGQVLDERRRDP